MLEPAKTTEPPSLSITNKPNKPLLDKLNKILHSSTIEDAKIKAALTSFSDIPDLNEPHLRRNLRSIIEKREISANKKLLGSFEKVLKRFEILETQLQGMDNVCKNMKGKIEEVELQTTGMIEKANKMQEHRSLCSTRIAVVNRFLEKFTLTEKEKDILNNVSEPISNVFFDSLSHLQQIHKDCQLLLTTTNQTAGREIMESMAAYQENAYDKLYRWMQVESTTAFGHDSIDVDSLMVKALKALMVRPVLFQTILDEIASARHDAVTRAFLNALTRGGPGRNSRPIELQAHDPLRYIGDMLAWVHQACASEKEMLESLFPINTESYRDISGMNIQVVDIIGDLLDCAMAGTCRPLKSRMEQVLILQPGAITSYKAANLIQFYTLTLSKLMRKNSALEKALYEMTDLAYKYFFKTLSAQSDRLMQTIEPPNQSLNVGSVVRDMTIQLKEILASYDSSPIVTTHNTEGFPEFDFAETLDAIIEPLILMCELSVKKYDKMDHDIYIVNCLYHVQTVMAPYSFTKPKRENITTRMNDFLKDIANEEFNHLLKQSGLILIKEAISNKDPNVPLSSLSSVDRDSLMSIMSKFDHFLVAASADISSHLGRLSSVQHRREVQSKAIQWLLNAYSEISQEILDPKNKYEDSDKIMPRTVKDMEAIFSYALK